MKLPKNRQSGQALVMALILLALGGLIMVPVLSHSFTNLGYHQTVECKTVNTYTADSGVEYVLCKLYSQPGAYTEDPLQEGFTLNNRSVNVTAEYVGGGVYKVNSVASGGGCGSTGITCYVNLSAGSFSYALAGKNLVTLENALVESSPESGEGNIYSNGNIDLVGGKVLVNGDASAVGTITGQVIAGDRDEGSDPLAFPGDYSGLYEQMAKEGGTHPGDLTLQEGTHYLGPRYIDGNLEIKPNTTVILEGVVYVAGTMVVDNGRLEGEENICAEGDIELNGGGWGSGGSDIIPVFTSAHGDITLQGPVVNAVVWAPEGDVSVTNMFLWGAVGGINVSVTNAAVYWATQLSGREDLPGGELHTISYSYS